MTRCKVGVQAVLTAFVVSACSMAPAYKQPQVNVSAKFPQVQGNEYLQQGGIPATDLAWKDYFADPRLRNLIELALKNNKDLKIAALNAEAVRAQYAISQADRLPILSATGSGNRARVSQDLSQAGRSYITESYNVGLGVTAFELDLFGRVKSLSDVALNQYLSQQQVKDAARMALISSVAKAYFAERIAQEQMNLSAEILSAREKSKQLTDLKFKSGVISQVDVDVAQTQIETARSDYAGAEQSRSQANNAMALLIAEPIPENLPQALPLNQQFSDVELPVGLSSTVLYQRPDVRSAEFTLLSQNANIGAARAAFFPRISLTGSYGRGSNELNNLFHAGNLAWSFIPQITLPIFAWGQNKANLDLAHIRKNVAVLQYEKAVQSAFRDVADALAAREALLKQFSAQERGVKAQVNRYKLVDLRFKYGISSSLELLSAATDSYTSQQALLQTQLMLLNNRADVYNALGGGLS